MKDSAALPLASSPLRERSLRIRHVAVVWILFAAWPLVAGNDYVLSLGIFFFINLLLLGGLNLVMGYGGQISLCQAGFFGLGAYLSGVLSVRWGVPPAIGALAAMAGAALSAFVIGLPALRLRGHYLSMATLGFNAILSVLFNELVTVTGGPNGLSGVPPIALFGFAFDTPARFFWLAWLGGLGVMLLVASLLASRAGRALRAVSGSEVAADSMGIDPFRSKLAAFMASAVAAGLAGALYVHFNQYASPETFSFSASVLLVVMVAIGGWGRFWGPLFGAAVFTAVPELLRRIQDAELLVFGAGMVVVLLFLPGGIASLAARLGRRRKTAAAEPKKEKVTRHGLA